MKQNKTLEEIKKKLEDYECIGMYCNHAETEDPHYTIGITDLTNLLSQTKQELIEEINVMKKFKRIVLTRRQLMSIAKGELSIRNKDYSIHQSKKFTGLGLPVPEIYIDIRFKNNK